MYLTVKQQVKHLSRKDFQNLKTLAHAAKNLTNEAIYNIRQHYFQCGEYLNYHQNYRLLRTSPNYRILNSNMAQQILKEVDGTFKSFFGLLKLAKEGKYNRNDIRLPHYLPKDGYTTLVIGFVRLNGNQLILPYSRQFKQQHEPVVITIPPNLLDKKIKEIRIIPKADARFFEIQYTYEVCEEQRNLNKNHALAIDFGVNNLASCVTSAGKSFLIDGRRLKSINQWFNKENARLQSIKDRQQFGKGRTNRQKTLARKRNNKVNDYLSKTARYIINYCLTQDIGTLVIGYQEAFQRNSRIGKRNNQNFVNIPFGQLCRKLEYLSRLYGIVFVKQEESYTSKASFFDQDIIPMYQREQAGKETFCIHSFSGRRIRRGLYETNTGQRLNADINGALNILQKSSVVSLTALYSRGEVDTPVRIRVA